MSLLLPFVGYALAVAALSWGAHAWRALATRLAADNARLRTELANARVARAHAEARAAALWDELASRATVPPRPLTPVPAPPVVPGEAPTAALLPRVARPPSSPSLHKTLAGVLAPEGAAGRGVGVPAFDQPGAP